MIEHVYLEPEAQARQILAVLRESGLDPVSRRVLDIGCGTGAYARLLLEAGAASVTGIDVSAQNIDIVRRLTPDPRVDLHVCSLDAFEADEPFDVVFAKGVLYYCGDLGQAARRIHSLLAPGGTLFATFTERCAASVCANALKHVASRLPPPLRPAFRDALAVAYRVLHAGGPARTHAFSIVRRKMNTIFFPADYLATPDEATRTLAANGFAIRSVIPRQAWRVLRSDFGVLAQAGAGSS